MGPCCEQTHAAFEVGLSLDHGQGISSGWSDIDGSSQLRLCHTCIIDVMINHSHARDTQQTYEDMCVRSIYIPRILWEVITCSCPWYLLLAHKSSYFEWNIAACNSQLVLDGCTVGKVVHEIKELWKRFLYYWPFCEENPWTLGDSPCKGPVMQAFVFSLLLSGHTVEQTVELPVDWLTDLYLLMPYYVQ